MALTRRAAGPTRAVGSVAQDLELGSGHPGQLVVAGGGSVQVAGSVLVDNIATAAAASSRMLVSGVEDETQTPATLLINQDILLGNADGAASELTVSAGGIVDLGPHTVGGPSAGQLRRRVYRGHRRDAH
ncbi:hypothetical protein HC891_25485, partial [Candidatus Gracilibacteria bacterium]|nr:hypothetical protein [Candidatus Gracilibacteria bacterium]